MPAIMWNILGSGFIFSMTELGLNVLPQNGPSGACITFMAGPCGCSVATNNENRNFRETTSMRATIF